MACTNCGGDKKTYLEDGEGITFTGAGTQASPYKPHLAAGANLLSFEVRDSSTINFTLYGSGLPGDPLVLTGDTSSASRLVNLGDVAASPAPSQGRVPLWIGSPTNGRFELRTPGTRYTTRAGRGDGLYQGEQIKEIDTGGRFEWDGSQYVDLTPATVAPTALDSTVLQNKGTLDGSTDWNSLTSASGIYRIFNGVNSSNNTPAGAYGFGTLVVYKSGDSVTQVYHAHNSSRTYERTKWNATDWYPWNLSAVAADIQAEATSRANADNGLQNQVNAEATVRSQQDAALDGKISQLRTDATNGDSGLRASLGNKVQNVANATNLAAGEGVVTNFTRDSTTGQYFGYLDISYGPFNGTPRVLATAVSADSGGVICEVQNRAPGGSRIYLSRRNNADTGVMWIAVGN